MSDASPPVGILLISHLGVASAIQATASRMLGTLPLRNAVVEVAFDADMDQLARQVDLLLRGLDQGAGVLILTDLYGASPSNLAERFDRGRTHTRRVSGLNLSMLMRVMNYAEQNLDELVNTAVLGARGGVVIDRA
ncbi:MAG: PTS system mannose-specific EIIAB component [Alphaproteobacteria bacterium ADurb.BinA280]|jgi:mannose PTS system EIIA component|nr:PTS sugar transporter subunit IIA [Xanthomonadales bacterium]MCC6504797.1 PTS sugar transporter subunit IIA [Aquimonas sp.]OPZ10691.1 MAG: PTS system mannose-specific EIIAB component [Alphaproteobacteria bacterium ADurb.BinA280]